MLTEISEGGLLNLTTPVKDKLDDILEEHSHKQENENNGEDSDRLESPPSHIDSQKHHSS